MPTLTEMPETSNYYLTDFGPVTLPSDFPGYAYTKRGIPDRRYKIAKDLWRYEKDLRQAAQDLWIAGKDVRKMKVIPFGEWRKSCPHK